ncbi:transcription factor DIVARICATA-like [Andrographis paniculata]|uniref:transcription factor DIVARICATA-like n=1 Tax=Andrographis paniculata TaxID=175694 RepID=UPI0021E778C7|nr:transcription factor DIVARICATA-like [Andrographis paniculata]XP_051123098.1 transcription factor DIVARICATA-like [Andrographis paniculata]
MESLCETSVGSDSSWFLEQQGMATAWTKEENKKFESALAIFDEKTPYRWFKVAAMIPGKSVNDVINQYKELVADVCDIEAGLVPIPAYLASSFTYELADLRSFDVCRKRQARATINDQEHRKKGVPWTEDEHRRFLLGLQKHGKGDWRNISRNFVISKTPTQVASHAQKYYLRQLSGAKDKRRPSIHDITTVHLAATPPSSEQQKPASSAPKPPVDGGRIDDKMFMVFDPAAYGSDSLVAYPCNLAAQTWHSAKRVAPSPHFRI